LSGIYVIRNINTNKVYVGSTKNFGIREKTHFRTLENGNHSSIKLQRSYNKHGRSAFVFEVIERTPYRKKIILEREKHWMEELDSLANGYNIAPASFGDVLTHHPEKEAIIAKIRAGVLKRNAFLTEDERKARWSMPGELNPMYGKTHSATARTKISEANIGHSRGKGIPKSPEHREKISERAKMRIGEKNSFFGKSHTDEYKKAASDRRKGVKPTNTLTVVIEGNEYQGLQDASKATGINPITIRHRCLSENPKFTGFYYKDHIAPPKQTRAPRPHQKSPNRKAVVVFDVIYESSTEAAEHLGVSKHVLYNRIKSDKYPDYKYL
jgi:group I intron endonuclease